MSKKGFMEHGACYARRIRANSWICYSWDSEYGAWTEAFRSLSYAEARRYVYGNPCGE